MFRDLYDGTKRTGLYALAFGLPLAGCAGERSTCFLPNAEEASGYDVHVVRYVSSAGECESQTVRIGDLSVDSRGELLPMEGHVVAANDDGCGGVEIGIIYPSLRFSPQPNHQVPHSLAELGNHGSIDAAVQACFDQPD